MILLVLILTVVFAVLWLKARGKVQELSKYQTIADAEAEAKRIREDAEADRNSASDMLAQAEKDATAQLEHAQAEATLKREHAEMEAAAITAKAKTEADTKLEQAQKDATAQLEQAKQSSAAQLEQAEKDATARLGRADTEAARIVADAQTKAKEILGDAYETSEHVSELKLTELALRNTIHGYGDEWLKPTYSLLDELAEDFGHTDAGVRLKDARQRSVQMVTDGAAATCDYVEHNRRETAIRFVLDAFNGKVDSILSKTKRDNYGKLEQQIKDAYQLVNMNGAAFRNARINPAYLDARLQELHWAVIVTELKAKAQEEQRRIKEQMREEQKAQREFERAKKEAEKEEAMLKRAMEKAKSMLEKSTEAQRAKYESQLAELEGKLKEAEERNQRATSLAQQTRHGNVYVISNVGSFGENVYKIGMTRRWNPLDRVRELGDASVPFMFDVHAIIESDDAPALAHTLHQELAMMQVNKVNPRREYFRASLSDIRKLVEKHGYTTQWTMEAEAAEYKETLAIEQRMKDDPEAQKKWAAFYAQIAADTSDEIMEE